MSGSDRDRLWTARLRAAAAHWRECYASARESIGLALGQIEQISADRDALTQRAEAAEQQAAALRETFDYLMAVADEVARGETSRSALKIAVAQIQSGVAPGQAALAASSGAAGRAGGRRVMATLPALNPDATCPKCGHQDVYMGYRHEGCSYPARCGVRWDGGEHMDRVCQRCHYVWAEAVMQPRPAGQEVRA